MKIKTLEELKNVLLRDLSSKSIERYIGVYVPGGGINAKAVYDNWLIGVSNICETYEMDRNLSVHDALKSIETGIYPILSRLWPGVGYDPEKLGTGGWDE